MHKLTLLLLCVVMGCGMLGCGEAVKSTNGTLTLSPITSTDRTGGVYNVNTSVTYAVSGKDVTGTKIKFSWKATPAGSTTPTSDSATATLGTDGIGYLTFDVNQTTVAILIDITASYGDLTSQTQQVTIPAVIPFSATPTVVVFDTTAALGNTATITLAGTYAPYTASSSTTEINVGVSATTVTLTKTSASGTTLKNSSITLTDHNGTVIQVPVYYY